ncbi:glycerate 2-kinase [Sulfuracidifex tepidarius]|uniref:Glycerate 2-kinase n=1 Tax=Sulfuracidifex tepidarius TaxID=1294262 RepID=A0A510E442_9CREN|nr:glycerate 2-kinase [Sulfuracidifex tepidarius]BBG26838.1 Glycerate 2-kinase [Sulfuracidifex tepidarius]
MKVRETVDLILREADPREPTLKGLKQIPEILLERPLVIAVGKASVKMYNAMTEKVKPWKSIVVTNAGDAEADVVIRSGHPFPNEESFRAGETVLDAVRKGGYTSILFLLSGGASSLMEWSDRLSPQDFRKLNEILVTSGLSIDEINVVRKHVSSIKGGRLALESSKAVFTLVVSDVVGGDISSVGSGPTIPDQSTLTEALEIMKSIDIKEDKFIKALTETPKEIPNSKAWVVLDVDKVVENVKWKLNGISLSSCVRGEARDFGYTLSSILNNSRKRGEPLKPPFTVVAGGEPEVKITGNSGKGGRNGEVCLSLARYAKGEFEFLALATDGIDGNSEYAGCYITSGHGLKVQDIEKALREHSSYEILEKNGNVLNTGLTGTNVNNIYVLYAP